MKKSHNSVFSVICRKDRNTKSNFFITQLHLESPILGKPLLVKFQVRQNFDAGSDTRSAVSRKHHCVMQHSVETVSDNHFIFQWFNVYIGSILDNRMF